MAGNQEAFQKSMNQGHSAAWDQDWKKAAQFYSAALAEFPESSPALASLGLAYLELEDYQSSLECYQRAAKVSPTDPVPCEKLARLFERMGNPKEASQAAARAAELHLQNRDAEKAIDNWLHVLTLVPDHLPTRQRLAAVYERMGRKTEAVNEYIAAASILQRSGDLQKALKAVEYATQMQPDSQDARFALHTLRASQLLPRPGRPRRRTGTLETRAVRTVEKTTETENPESRQDPIVETHQKALVQLAALMFEQVDEPSSEMASRKGLNALTRGLGALGSSGNDRTRITLHLSQAIDSETSGDEAQIIEELDRAIDLGLREPAASYEMGRLLCSRDPEKALRNLQESVRHPDYALASHLLCGQIHLDNGRLREAAIAYIQALALADASLVEPKYAEELHQLYEPMVDAQNDESDEDALKNICSTISGQLMRPDWRSFLKMARQQMPQQSPDSAPLPVAEMILESRSSLVVEMMAHVREYGALNLNRTAMEEAYYALQFAPTYLPLHTQIGELLFAEGHHDEAVRKFSTVADLYIARGEVARAVRILKRTLQIAPMDLKMRERLIDLLVSQEKTEEAMDEYMDLADLYYRQAELDKARQIYMTALKVAQRSKNSRTWGVDILLKVADIDLQKLNLRQAVRIYEQVRTIQPENMAVRTQIAQLYFRLNQEAAALNEVDSFLTQMETANKRPQAIEFINDLLIEQTANLDLRRRLADLYAKEGKIAEAVSQIDRVAEAYLDQGKNMEAINMMETIIALHPANVEEYRKALDALRRSSLRK